MNGNSELAHLGDFGSQHVCVKETLVTTFGDALGCPEVSVLQRPEDISRITSTPGVLSPLLSEPRCPEA